MEVPRQKVSDRILTVPNLLSLLRLALVPVFLVLIIAERDGLALIVLVISSVSDYFDGMIARRFNLITRLGQLLDPAADRLFIFAALIGLSIRDVVPWWLFAAIVARDVMLLVLGVVLANHGHGPLPVHFLGKAGTLCLFYALPILMLAQALPAASPIATPVGWAFALWGLFLYWWGGAVYAVETGRLVRTSRDESASGSATLGS